MNVGAVYPCDVIPIIPLKLDSFLTKPDAADCDKNGTCLPGAAAAFINDAIVSGYIEVKSDSTHTSDRQTEFDMMEAREDSLAVPAAEAPSVLNSTRNDGFPTKILTWVAK
jgi:hypothetical protein